MDVLSLELRFRRSPLRQHPVRDGGREEYVGAFDKTLSGRSFLRR